MQFSEILIDIKDDYESRKRELNRQLDEANFLLEEIRRELENQSDKSDDQFGLFSPIPYVPKENAKIGELKQKQEETQENIDSLYGQVRKINEFIDKIDFMIDAIQLYDFDSDSDEKYEEEDEIDRMRNEAISANTDLNNMTAVAGVILDDSAAVRDVLRLMKHRIRDIAAYLKLDNRRAKLELLDLADRNEV